MSDHGHFSSYEGHRERRMGKIRGAFLRMHKALDGWMLARAPALPAQGLCHTIDLGISIFLILVRCVTLRNLDVLIKTGWSVNCTLCCRKRWSWVGDNNPSRWRLLSIWSKEV